MLSLIHGMQVFFLMYTDTYNIKPNQRWKRKGQGRWEKIMEIFMSKNVWCNRMKDF